MKGFETFEATPKALPAEYLQLSRERVRFLREGGRAREMCTGSLESTIALTRITRGCRLHRRRLREPREAQLSEELEEAQSKGLASEEWRICRLMAGAGVGPRRSQYGHIASYTPSMEEWVENLATPSSKGGMSATEISEADFTQSISRFDVDGLPSIDDASQAERDFERIAKRFSHGPPSACCSAAERAE
eukprot:2206046-Pyramimonas_sp.AAC.1